MAGGGVINLTVRRRWWLRIMLPTLFALAWCAAAIVHRLPERMRPQINWDRVSQRLAGIIRRGLIIKVEGRPASSSSN